MKKRMLLAALFSLSIIFSAPSTSQELRQDAVAVEQSIGSMNNALTRKAIRQRLRNVPDTQHMARVSWYRHGRITANGERFDPMGVTVAHRSLPFGTVVRFTDTLSGNVIEARVNDRGPFIPGREYDLSMGAAQHLGIIERGVVNLVVEIISEAKRRNR